MEYLYHNLQGSRNILGKAERVSEPEEEAVLSHVDSGACQLLYRNFQNRHNTSTRQGPSAFHCGVGRGSGGPVLSEDFLVVNDSWGKERHFLNVVDSHVLTTVPC